MKASLKFRDEQKPLFRAKVPLNILGFPFQSGILAGESKELSLNLSTFFESGPSVKLAYRPSDSLNPFSLVFKTGIGRFGSPISSSMTMSAEFNLVGGAHQNPNPSFFVQFKPQFGDFSIKKSQSSSKITKLGMNSGLNTNGGVSDEDGSVEVVETPVVNGGDGYLMENGFKKITVLPPESQAVGAIRSVFSGTEVSARTSVPLRRRATVSFLWGVRLPPSVSADEAVFGVKSGSNSISALSFGKFPMLVLNKIGIEHVASDDSKDSEKKVGSGDAGVAEASLDVKRQLELIQAENRMLRNAFEDWKSEITAAKFYKESGKIWPESKKSLDGFGGKTVVDGGKKVLDGGDGNEELKK